VYRFTYVTDNQCDTEFASNPIPPECKESTDTTNGEVVFQLEGAREGRSTLRFYGALIDNPLIKGSRTHVTSVCEPEMLTLKNLVAVTSN